MNGLIYTINLLGETLAATEQALAQVREENMILRSRVAELEATQAPSDSTSSE